MQSRTGSQVAQGGRFEESRGRGERAGSAEHAWSAAKAKRRASDAFAQNVDGYFESETVGGYFESETVGGYLNGLLPYLP